MTRSQVRYLLGTPMVPAPFDKDRWDYLYYFQSGKRLRKPDQRHLVVFFKDDKVTQVRARQRAARARRRPPTRAHRSPSSRRSSAAAALARHALPAARCADRASAAGTARCGRRRAHAALRAHGSPKMPTAALLPRHRRRRRARGRARGRQRIRDARRGVAARPSTGTAARAWRRPPGSACAAPLSGSARAARRRRHRPASATVCANSDSNSTPARRFVKAKRMVSSTRQPSARSASAAIRPSRVRNGPLTSCMCDARVGLEVVAGGEFARAARPGARRCVATIVRGRASSTRACVHHGRNCG